MHLHMRQFDGITFGMEAQSAQTVRVLKKHAFYGEVKPHGWSRTIKHLCVPAKYVAAAMGPVAWLVTEKRCMETIRWGDSPEHYIIYEEDANAPRT